MTTESYYYNFRTWFNEDIISVSQPEKKGGEVINMLKAAVCSM